MVRFLPEENTENCPIYSLSGFREYSDYLAQDYSINQDNSEF